MKFEIDKWQKVTKNLWLDEAAAEQYSVLHDTNISRLVSDLLMQLPVDEPTRPLPPVVRRLIGIGISGALPDDEGSEPDIYRDHLDSKYDGS